MRNRNQSVLEEGNDGNLKFPARKKKKARSGNEMPNDLDDEDAVFDLQLDDMDEGEISASENESNEEVLYNLDFLDRLKLFLGVMRSL
jgi:hypothetical protein